MNHTPAHGIVIPFPRRPAPSPDDPPVTLADLARRLEACNERLRRCTVPTIPPPPASSPEDTLVSARAPLSTEADPEFESGERPIRGRGTAASVEQHLLPAANGTR